MRPSLPQIHNHRKKPSAGRVPIFYVLRTGCQWKALPRSLGSGSTAHAYFQKWCGQGVFETLWSLCLEDYDVLEGIEWKWLAADGAMTKAPLAVRR